MRRTVAALALACALAGSLAGCIVAPPGPGCFRCGGWHHGPYHHWH